MPEKKRAAVLRAKDAAHPTSSIETADGAVDVQLRGVKERDLDLFFLEEIVLNTAFRRWFFGQLRLASAGRLIAAARSVNTSTGESDLEFTLRNGEESTKVLVENKIDAVLQSRQGERYRERAASYIANGDCHRAVTVLIAPASYGEKRAGFDRALTYEDVEQALTAESGEDERRRYKLLLLRAAIQRGNAGWTLIPDRAATGFWRGYWELSRSIAPELQMPEPGEKPATSNFIRFEPSELGPEVELFHKVPYGHVDLQFARKAGDLQAFKTAHQAQLDPEMKIERANKSLVIRMTVARTHVNAPLSEAEGAVCEGLAAAQRLLRWYVRWMGSGRTDGGAAISRPGEPAPFPQLVAGLYRHGATGSLRVTGPVHPNALYFREGRILFGSSNDPRNQLRAILVESGRISEKQLDEVNAKVGPGNPLAKVLVESGFVNQRELGDAAREKVERIVADVLSSDWGSFEFEDLLLPEGAVDLELSTERLFLSAIRRIPDRSFALRHVALSSVLEPVPEGATALSAVRAELWPLLGRLDGHRSLKEAISLAGLDEVESVKGACAMLFLGIVRRSDAAANATPPPVPETPASSSSAPVERDLGRR